jgi:hypothetical protein
MSPVQRKWRVSGLAVERGERRFIAGRTWVLGLLTMTKWEYATVPLLTHATKQILDQWGEDGWELVSVLPGPTGEQLVAYLKRPKGQ